jgi:3-phenylpropionate/trans-cinnamate dioxygenase ferredoxin subunit
VRSPKVVRHVVGEAASLLPGERWIIKVGGRSIGVFNVNGAYLAVRDLCPHHGAPLCRGTTGGLATARFREDRAPEIIMEREGEVIKCPWHGWQFDLRTGQAVFGDRVRVATYRAYLDSPPMDMGVPGPVETYKTSVESGVIIVEVPAG